MPHFRPRFISDLYFRPNYIAYAISRHDSTEMSNRFFWKRVFGVLGTMISMDDF